MAVGCHGDSCYSLQGWVRVNLCTVAGVWSRLNTVEQCVCQKAQCVGGASVWDWCQMWGDWERILGAGAGRFRLKFDSHDKTEVSCQKCAKGTVDLALLEQQLRGLFSTLSLAGCLAEIVVYLSDNNN